MKKYDFSGWATKNNLRCSDGRTIRKNAFKEDDGKIVPLVWNHCHDDPSNVLGHALLENRDEGVYAYCSFNNTPKGREGRELVKHGDITSLSIYANHLKQQSGNVLHGEIKEVSLVLAGANPEALINSIMAHSDDPDLDDEAIIFSDEDIELYHSDEDAYADDEEDEDEEGENDMPRTVQDVLDEMTEEQQNVVYGLVGMAVDEAIDEYENSSDEEDEEDDEDYDDEDYDDEDYDEDEEYDDDEGEEVMHHNCFEEEYYDDEEFLSHDDTEAIFDDAHRYGSLKDAVLAHGIDDIEYLFPDAQTLDKSPDFIKREDAWVTKVMNGVHHTPFSRIKSMFANITEADARARGYIKGNRKVEEVFGLLKRTTTPTTIYKKQKLDRDDVIDINDFDVVAWLKTEMRMMLNEEIARAILVGDGRATSSDDKINEQCIRPIWTDDDLYTIKKTVPVSSTTSDTAKGKAFMRAAIKARKEYKGTGSPSLYTTEDVLTDLLLMEDAMGRIIYDTPAKLATALRVSEIVTVPVMENLSRNDNGTTKYLWGIIVNLVDYNVGADKGGSVNMFDDFDIDYNAQKYLIETRCSGALTKPYSAIAIEMVYSLFNTVNPADPDEELLGKTASDLQNNVVIHDDFITGNLNYVTGYTGFSGDVAEQSGNYLALKFDHTAGSTTTLQLLGSDHPDRIVTLDSDMLAVLRISDRKLCKLKVVTTNDGVSIEKTYSLSSLRCATAAN